MVFRIPILGLTLRDALVLFVIGYAFLLYEKEGFRKKQLEFWDKILPKVWDSIQRFFNMGPYLKKKGKKQRPRKEPKQVVKLEDPLEGVKPLEKEDPLEELEDVEEGY